MGKLQSLVFVLLLSGAAGCASSYQPVPIDPGALIALPFRVQDENLEIGADAYTDRERQSELFQADLSQLGVLPVLLRVVNHGPDTYRLRRVDISLVGANGQVVNRLPGSAVARAATAPQGTVRGFSCMGQRSCTVLLIRAAVGIMETARFAAEETARFDDYRSKELSDVLLAPNQSAHGFLYFEWAVKGKATLRISLINTGAVKRRNFELPLLGP